MIRLATFNDIDKCMECIEDARAFLKASNSIQWNTSLYPAKSDILEDIENNQLYLYENDQNILGIVALIVGSEPNYDTIYDGNWKDLRKPYLSLHRIALRSNARGTDVASSLVNHAKDIMKINGLSSIKADTAEPNIAMQKLLLKCGFKRAGNIILLQNEIDRDRIAFEYTE